jgi:uncharacterized protein YjeT (DUF2065 family)
MKEMMRRVLEQPEQTLRKLGFILMVAGLFLIYICRGYPK